MNKDIIERLNRLKYRRRIWEKVIEEDGDLDQSDEEIGEMTRTFY